MDKGSKSYLKSVSILTIGSVISIIFLGIHHVALPFIFTAEELGIKSVVLALPQAFVGVLCGRYDLTLVYEEDEDRIPALLKLNVLIIIGSSTAITVINCLYFSFFKSSYMMYWYLVPAIWVYLVVYGLTLTLNSYNNRYRDYVTISKMHALRTAAQSLGPVILGVIFIIWLKIHAVAIAILVIPYCLGMGCGLYSQGKSVLKRKDEILSSNRESVISIARKHIKQPLLSAPAILANGLSYSLITIFTDFMFGEAVTGYYSLSVTLLGLPISLISANMSKVYTKDGSVEFEKTGRYIKTFNKNLLFLVILAIPMFFLMYFLAPPICTLVFGEKWTIAGVYIKALAMMFSFRFVSTALSPGLYICRKQVAELIIQTCFVVVTVLVGVICYILKVDSVSFMWIMGTARSLVMLIHILIIYYYAKYGDGGENDGKAS